MCWSWLWSRHKLRLYSTPAQGPIQYTPDFLLDSASDVRIFLPSAPCVCRPNQKTLWRRFWSKLKTRPRDAFHQKIFKGTASRDGLGFCWHSGKVPGLNKGRGMFLNFPDATSIWRRAFATQGFEIFRQQPELISQWLGEFADCNPTQRKSD
jgi:hypothetical protein